MTRDQVKAILDRVLTWPKQAQQEAVASLKDHKMSQALSDEDVALQILRIFGEHHVLAGGTLQRNQFFKVRNGDFRRGLNKAVEKNWIMIKRRDRYTYELTKAGFAEVSAHVSYPAPPRAGQ